MVQVLSTQVSPTLYFVWILIIDVQLTAFIKFVWCASFVWCFVPKMIAFSAERRQCEYGPGLNMQLKRCELEVQANLVESPAREQPGN